MLPGGKAAMIQFRNLVVRMIKDIHTHNVTDDAIISIEPGSQELHPDKYYSVGIHPWNSEFVSDDLLDMLYSYSRYDNVVAIGETGIDVLKGASREKQKELFLKHADIAADLRKPLIIHAVRSYSDIIGLHKKLRPDTAWIIHGFRGNVNIADSLLKEGFYLSYGEMFNEASLLHTPLDRMFVETDCSKVPVGQIYSDIAGKTGIKTNVLEKEISANIQRLFPGLL